MGHSATSLTMQLCVTMLACGCALLLLCAVPLAAGAPHAAHQRKEAAFLGSVPTRLRARLQAKAGNRARTTARTGSSSSTMSASPAPASNPLRSVSPVQFGGDPTGVKDSTAAVLAALGVCLNASKRSAGGTFSFGAANAGGCTVDLEGGEFLISQTVAIPTGVSNMKIQGGSLVANAASPYWKTAAPAKKPQPAHATANGDACAYPVSRTGQWCQGLKAGPKTATSAAACQAACCAANCTLWQLCAKGSPCSSGTPSDEECWLLHNGAMRCSEETPSEPNSMGWVGASKEQPLPPPPPPPPPAKFLITVGGTAPCTNPQGSCNEDIGLAGLFLDGSHVASGIQVVSVMGTTIGPTGE